MTPEQTPAEKPGAYIQLKMPCPRCKGKLEKQVVAPPEKDKPQPPAEVRCQTCKVAWANYGLMLRECRPTESKLSIDSIQQIVAKGKAAVRGSRNVVERIRAAQTNLRRAANSIRNIREEGAVEEVGDSVENILDQVILALEDVKDIKKGTLKPFVGGQPQEEAPSE
jgi:hypothetical protein